jgi:hypothetical protein
MRQWELFGITDAEPFEVPDVVRLTDDIRGTFFWSTDVALVFRTMSDEAAATIGRSATWCEGRDVLATFGIEGTNLAILEAHTEALGGGEGRFTLDGPGGRVRCRVEPMHAFDGQVIGTFCLALPDDEPADALRVLVGAAA